MGVRWEKMPPKFRDFVKKLPPRTRSTKVPANAGVKKLENQFKQMWDYLGGPPLVAEFRFNPNRKWRSDFFHEPSKTLIEIEGLTVQGGRHQRIGGFQADCEKYLEGVLAGYRIIRLAPYQINRGTLQRIIELLAPPEVRCSK